MQTVGMHQKHGTWKKKYFLILCFVFIQKYYGRKSPTGRDVCRLRKAYYNARHEASAQIDEIVGETASEADSSETSVCEKENGHEKDEDVIRCICGLYKDEGLMIQCEKCMVRQGEHKMESGTLFLFSITSGTFTSNFHVASSINYLFSPSFPLQKN